MPNRIKQYYYNPLCFKCGSFFVEEHLFCSICFEAHIWPRFKIKKKDNHSYLFDWAPGESDLLSRMVYQLKSDRCVRALRYYANQLALQTDQNFDCIIPLPGSQKNSTHSQILAQEIARFFQVPLLDILTKKTETLEQKQKSAEERSQTKIFVKEHISNELFTRVEKTKLRVLFVDDVLTTGSTFKSACSALNLDPSTEIVTIFFRPSLRSTGFQS